MRSLIPAGAAILASSAALAGDLNTTLRASNINPYAIENQATRGAGIGIYLTEPTCPEAGWIDRYLPLGAVSANYHSRMTSAIARASAPLATVYCMPNNQLPGPEALAGVDGLPAIRVISRSNSGGDTDAYTTVDRDWDDFSYRHNVTIINSAGNTGRFVRSPAKGLNVITVGNYDQRTMAINPESSWIDSEVGDMKPELAMPGTNISVSGYTSTGTSFATPQVAGFVADLMSAWRWYRDKPYLVKAALLAGASVPIGGGEDRVGVGGLDFRRTFYGGRGWYFIGRNGTYPQITVAQTLPKRRDVRVAAVWATRGSWTYAHKRLGADYDLVIYGPDGHELARGESRSNPFEVVVFDATTAGAYELRLTRVRNDDTQAETRIGIRIN